MPDWNSRLAVSWQDSSGVHKLVPVDAFAPSFSLNAEVLHSIEATHIGVVYSPKSMTFSLSVKAIGDSAAQLTALALSGTRFDIILQETDQGSDWSFAKIVMQECIITSASPTNAVISGAPAATFSGFSLASQVQPKTGSPVSLP
jgi:thiamine pyrophosphokinase